jgi:hypothetical protein
MFTFEDKSLDIDRAQVLLDNSASSDLNICFGLFGLKGRFEDIIEWLDSKVLPLSHQVRFCRVADTILSSFKSELLFKRFSQRQ